MKSNINLPFVSIIVPVRNEAAHIKGCLESVFAQDYPLERIEIIVVDGMSNDITRNVVISMQETFSNIRLVDNPKLSTPAAINVGFKLARGQILIIVGGHSYISDNYVRMCVHYLEFQDADCVGGVLITTGKSYKAQVIAAAMSSPFGVGNSLFRVGTLKPRLVDTVAFAAYRRSVIEKVGLFNESMIGAEDDEYNYRLRKLGGKILLIPDITSRYFTRNNLRELWKQYFAYGKGKVLVFKKYPNQMSMRQFIPLAFVVSLIGSLLLFFSPNRLPGKAPKHKASNNIPPVPHPNSRILVSCNG